MNLLFVTIQRLAIQSVRKLMGYAKLEPASSLTNDRPSGPRLSSARAPFKVALQLLLLPFTLQALQITEFLPENDGGLRDNDGDSPDWIELHNDSPATVNLGGWHLTDSADNLTRWTFPATNLDAGAFLVVFASGKNRASAGGELHTNFRLEQSGGFLALVQPDGVTLASAFTNYPALRRNVSFGPGNSSGVTSTLLAAGASGRWLVPANAGLGESWAQAEFDAATWNLTTTPLHYEVSLEGTQGPPILSVDINDRDNANAGNTQTGFQGFVIGAVGGNGAIQTGTIRRDFGNLTVALSNSGAGVGYDDRLRATPGNDGPFTLEDIFRDFVFSRELSGTSGLDLYITGLISGQLYQATIWSFDTGSSNDRVSDWYANRALLVDNYTFNGSAPPNNNELYHLTLRGIADESGGLLISGRRDSSSLAASPAVFINAFEIAPVSADTATNGNVAAMAGVNGSVYLRQLFGVADPGLYNQLTLRIRHDDGFVAYLNGVEIARRNAPSAPAWNSTATEEHEGTLVEEIPLSGAAALLVAGNNVLALHGLNAAASDPDFFLQPELLATFNTVQASRFFTPPTPGGQNGLGYEGVVAGAKFSVDRGFFGAPFSVALTTATPGAEIHWTTNGNPPTLTAGAPYTGPITITDTAFLRAAAYRSGFIPSEIDTHSYLFLESVIRQPGSPPGYPAIWPDENYPADYEMDPNVVNDPDYEGEMIEDLRAIPTLSIVTDYNSLWNNSTGIYLRAESSGGAWERAASAELINPDGSTAFAVNCALRMQGNASRDNIRTPKHSMRLLFKSGYGPAKLRFPWFNGPVDEFDNIVLRACFTDAWTTRYGGSRYRPEDSLYLRDVWTKDSLRDMGQLSGRGDFVHLYLNGLYWGLYNPTERLDSSYFAQHVGGREEDWDVIRDFSEVLDGSKADWNQMMALVNGGAATDQQYRAVTNLVDVESLIDYMMLHIFAEAEDWPSHNWYAAHRRATNGLPATKWIFLAWDQEIVLDQQVRRDRTNVSDNDTPARIYSQLRANPEFRVRFGDRIQKQFFNEGALAPSNNIVRLEKRVARIQGAIVGESARWGDAREFATPSNPATGQTFTRNDYFIPEVQGLYENFFPALNAVNLARFRSVNLYPSLDAPSFNQFGGAISNGFELVISQDNGGSVVYFTLDGSDPRVPGTGQINPNAAAYSAPLEFTAPTQVRARVYNGGNWSALVEAFFYPLQDLTGLRLTEIMYNPPSRGGVDGEELEFLELKNVGNAQLELGGLFFSGALSYVFPIDVSLAPGAFWVLVRNAAEFSTQYSGSPADGIYSGRLANEGERISLSLPGGGRLFSVDYQDRPPWPLAADGFGFSLVPREPNPAFNSDNGQDWRASALPGGSPGADDPAPERPAILINELLANPILPALDEVELFNSSAAPVDIGGWFLSDSAGAFKKFRIPDHTLIEGNGFITFTESDFNPSPGNPESYAFGARGDDAYLLSADLAGNLTGYSHGFSFNASPPGVTLGRHVNSVGEEDFVAQMAATFDAPNAGPRVGPIVIGEIHYHPAEGGDEFIELANVTTQAVALFDELALTNTWVISGLGYTLPPDVIVPPNGLLLLVATNPAAFRAKHDVAADVPILGPYGGVLQDSGERLKLQRPGAPDTNGTPYYTVDMVRYNDHVPWPPSADGAGFSLNKWPIGAYGNDPAHWFASLPSPGSVDPNEDSDGDGVPNGWELAHNTAVFVADADEDADSDGLSNGEEYMAGTDPQSALSYLKVDRVRLATEGIVVEFLAVAGRTYSLLRGASLEDGVWQNVANIPSAPTDRAVSVTNSLNGASQFYRLVTSPFSQ